MTDDLRPRRSILYVPAANARAIDKARGLDADGIILDLEDAVAVAAKDAARTAAVAAVAAGGWGHRSLMIRVNALATPWSVDDFAALRGLALDAVVVPKVDSARQAAEAVARSAGLPVWAMIETPRGVLDAPAIAATDGVAALLAGLADLARELRCDPGRERAPLHYSMAAIVLAARAAGVLAFDGVCTGIHDLGGLEAEACQAAAFGFDGKSLIHPGHLAAANRAFTPGEAAVADARGLIAAYESALAAGVGVTTYDGKLVEVLHVATARRLLAVADAVAGRG